MEQWLDPAPETPVDGKGGLEKSANAAAQISDGANGRTDGYGSDPGEAEV